MSDGGVIKVSEWSRKSFSSISLGRFGAVWMVNLVDKLLEADAARPFALKFNEASRAFLAQRCGKKARRYVAIIEYGEGRRRGVIMILEGVNGRGWRMLAESFQEVVNFLGSSRKGHSSLVDAGRRKGVSFADAVKRNHLLAYSGKDSLKGGGFSKAAGRGNVLLVHEERVAKHASLEADGSVSKEVALTDFSATDRSGVCFCAKHFRSRLLGLKAEMDLLF